MWNESYIYQWFLCVDVNQSDIVINEAFLQLKSFLDGAVKEQLKYRQGLQLKGITTKTQLSVINLSK